MKFDPKFKEGEVVYLNGEKAIVTRVSITYSLTGIANCSEYYFIEEHHLRTARECIAEILNRKLSIEDTVKEISEIFN